MKANLAPHSRRSFLRRTGAALALPLLTRPDGLSPVRAAVPPVQAQPEMPISVFSKHLQWLNYIPMAETAAAIGFDAVDLTVRPGGHVLPENVEHDLPRAVASCERVGLKVHMMTTAITDPDDPHTEPILRTAAENGISTYRMGYLRYVEGEHPMKTLETHRRTLERLAALNEKYGLHGAYQNHAGRYVGAAVWDLWPLLDGLDPQWIGCQYDIRHAVVEGGTAWPGGLALLRPYVHSLVMKDFVWDQDGAGRWYILDVPIGQGMVPFDRFFEETRKLDIAAPISVHFEYPMPVETHSGTLASELRGRTTEVMRRDLRRLRAFIASAYPESDATQDG